jgi:hypothetical protein
MSTAIINPSNLTFNGKEVRDIGEVVVQRAFTKPSISQQMTLVGGIEAKMQIAILGRLSKLTKLDAGCGTGAQAAQVPTSQKFWNPVRAKFWLEFCWKDFVATFMVYLQRKGIQRPDMTDTAIQDFIAELLPDALIEDFMRIVWFNSTTASLVGAGSGDANITAASSVTDYNLIDGLWKQLIAIAATAKIAVNATGGIGASNGQATYALQDSNLTSAGVIADLNLMKYSADLRLRDAPNAVYLVTQSVADKLEQYFQTLTNTEANYTSLQSGVKVAKWNGIPVIPMSFWDRTIRADYDNLTKYDKPHRAVLTTLENLQAGVDDTTAIGDFEVWYERNTEKVNFRGGYMVDAKEIEDYMVKTAY